MGSDDTGTVSLAANLRLAATTIPFGGKLFSDKKFSFVSKNKVCENSNLSTISCSPLFLHLFHQCRRFQFFSCLHCSLLQFSLTQLLPFLNNFKGISDRNFTIFLFEFAEFLSMIRTQISNLCYGKQVVGEPIQVKNLQVKDR